MKAHSDAQRIASVLLALLAVGAGPPVDQPRITKVMPAEAGVTVPIVVTVEKPPAGREYGQYILYLDRIPLKGIHPESYEITPAGELELAFRLDRNESSKAAWVKLLGGSFSRRPVRVALGTEERLDSDIAPLEKRFHLITLSTERAVALVVFLVCLAVVIYLMAAHSDLLRDRTVSPPEQPTPAKAESGRTWREWSSSPRKVRAPYSLAFTQAAFWFFLSVAGYVYIGLVTWDFLTVFSPSVLVLLGISASTGLAAVLIDADKQRRRAELEAEAEGLEATSVRPEPQDEAAKATFQDEKRRAVARLAEIKSQLLALPAATAKSTAFFTDIVSDAEGYSLHRFQIVIWTLVLGAVFVKEVTVNLVMPEFSTTLLTLMGISSGTYLGFKFPERSDPKPPA